MPATTWQVCAVCNLEQKLFSSVFDDVAVCISEKVLYKSCSRLFKLSNDVCHAYFGFLELELHSSFRSAVVDTRPEIFSYVIYLL
jgi:hypothetical protein